MSSPVVHARVLRYDGHKYSPGYVGARIYSDAADRFPCGAKLAEVHAAAVAADPVDTYWHTPWATLKSKRSRDAKLVTCPGCAERIRASGFVHARDDKGVRL